LTINSQQAVYNKRQLKKRCRMLPAGGLGVSPSLKKSPEIGGYRGLIETISAVPIRSTSKRRYEKLSQETSSGNFG
jgi:hypothetical protein